MRDFSPQVQTHYDATVTTAPARAPNLSVQRLTRFNCMLWPLPAEKTMTRASLLHSILYTGVWIKSTGGKLFLGRFPFKFTSGVHLSVCSSLYVGSVCKYALDLLWFLPSSPNDLLNCRDHWHDAAEPSTCHVWYLNTKTTWVMLLSRVAKTISNPDPDLYYMKV